MWTPWNDNFYFYPFDNGIKICWRCKVWGFQVGERNAIIFSADSGEPLPAVEELPDDFFKLNKDDIKLLYKEMKQKR